MFRHSYGKTTLNTQIRAFLSFTVMLARASASEQKHATKLEALEERENALRQREKALGEEQAALRRTGERLRQEAAELSAKSTQAEAETRAMITKFDSGGKGGLDLNDFEQVLDRVGHDVACP